MKKMYKPNLTKSVLLELQSSFIKQSQHADNKIKAKQDVRKSALEFLLSTFSVNSAINNVPSPCGLFFCTS